MNEQAHPSPRISEYPCLVVWQDSGSEATRFARTTSLVPSTVDGPYDLPGADGLPGMNAETLSPYVTVVPAAGDAERTTGHWYIAAAPGGRAPRGRRRGRHPHARPRRRPLVRARPGPHGRRRAAPRRPALADPRPPRSERAFVPALRARRRCGRRCAHPRTTRAARRSGPHRTSPGWRTRRPGS